MTKLIITITGLTALSLLGWNTAAAQLQQMDTGEETWKLESPALNSAENEPEVDAHMLRYSTILPGPQHVGYNTINSAGADPNGSEGFLNTISENPGYLFLSSALVPGLGQAANRQWWKTAVFAAVEASAIGVYIWKERSGRDGEQLYQDFAHENYSVAQYARWLVEYNHRFEENTDWEIEDLANDGYEDKIHEPRFVNGDPQWDHNKDWDIVDRDALNELERNSRYYQEPEPRTFPHTLDPYGSQQYYELISKYFKYGSGWQDWDQGLNLELNTEFMSPMWREHADIGGEFNSDLRIASNMLGLLIANHFVAALDAFFVGQLRNARVESSFSATDGPKLTLGIDF